jgi:hypothetical protein
MVTDGNADFLIDWAADPTYGRNTDVSDITKYRTALIRLRPIRTTWRRFITGPR